MRRLVIVALLAACVLPATAHAEAEGTKAPALSFELSGTVDPASAGWLDEALQEARERRAPLVVLRLDTPGGLDSSMRRMVQAILRAPMPVVVHVAPDGARAASAGLFVTLAGDVAAMAPRTNIGAATPVSLGGGEQDEILGRKVRNDAAAYARALAEARGRNADLAERMVRDTVSVTAEQAVQRGLVELLAADQQALVRGLDGRRLADGRPLDTTGLRVERRDTPLRYEIQALIVNPTVAYLLLLGGALGIVIEIMGPGLVGPGLFGAVALILGLYGAAQLPLTAAGVVLLLLAAGFLAAETQVPSGGLLGVAGAIALAAGGLLLFDTDSEVFSVSVVAAVATGAAAGLFSIFVAGRALRLRKAPARGGAADLVGAEGTVRTPLDPEGQIFVDGALWRARAAGDVHELPVGMPVRVEDVDDLTLTVRPLASSERNTP